MHLRLIPLLVCCCGSFGLAAMSGAGNGNLTSAGDLADATTPADVIGALIAARAGGSVLRIGAGLSGDWSTQADDPAAFTQSPIALTQSSIAFTQSSIAFTQSSIAAPATPVACVAATAAGHNAVAAGDQTPQAVAVPLPPALLASIPGVCLALMMSRRMTAR